MARKTQREVVLLLAKLIVRENAELDRKDVVRELESAGGFSAGTSKTAWEWLRILQKIREEWIAADQMQVKDDMYRIFCEATLRGRRDEGERAKKAIAHYAVENGMVKQGEYLLVDAGTTALPFVETLISCGKPIRLASIMTNNLLLLNQLKQGLSKGRIGEAYLVPGRIDWISGSIVGTRREAEDAIENYPSSLVVAFAAGVGRDGRMYAFEENQLSMKKAMLAKGKRPNCRILILCHETKIDHVSIHEFGSLGELSRKADVTLLTNKPTRESRYNGIAGSSRFKEAIQDLRQFCSVEVCNVEKGNEV